MAMESKKTMSTKKLFLYGVGELGSCLVFGLVGSFLTPYYTEVAGLSAGSVATMYLVLKVWDAINDPMMGALLDKAFAKHHNPKGKFRPWLFRAAPLLVITSILMWTAPTYVNGAAKILVAFVTYLLYEGSYTLWNIPYGAMLSAISEDDAERARYSSARGIGSMVAIMVSMAGFPILLTYFENNPQLGYTAGVTVCALLGFAACMICCMGTTEKHLGYVEEDVRDSNNVKITDILVVFKKNRAFTALCLVGVLWNLSLYVENGIRIYVFRDVFGNLPAMSVFSMAMVGVTVVLMLFIPMCVARVGSKNTLKVGFTIGFITYALNFVCYLLFQNVVVYIIISLITMITGSTLEVLQWEMIAQAIDYNELLVGKRTEGSIYGAYNLARRIGQGLGSSGAVAMLAVVGYVSNAEAQTGATLTGIAATGMLIPTALTILCLVAVTFGWNITPEIQKKIADMRNAKQE